MLRLCPGRVSGWSGHCTVRLNPEPILTHASAQSPECSRRLSLSVWFLVSSLCSTLSCVWPGLLFWSNTTESNVKTDPDLDVSTQSAKECNSPYAHSIIKATSQCPFIDHPQQAHNNIIRIYTKVILQNVQFPMIICLKSESLWRVCDVWARVVTLLMARHQALSSQLSANKLSPPGPVVIYPQCSVDVTRSCEASSKIKIVTLAP